MISVLYVDDDVQAHKCLRIIMENRFRLISAYSEAHALQVLSVQTPEVMLLSIKLPERSGLELLDALRKNQPDLPVIVLSGVSDISFVVGVIQAGAFDYIVKPFDYRKVEKTILCAGAHSARSRDLSGDTAQSLGTIIGESPVIRQVKDLIRKYSGSTSSVLVTGRSGTGKELVAQALHRLSSRSLGPFVAINCGAIPQNLMESELFGSEHGAFTDALQRAGRFEQACGGTLFRDEIAEMPLPAQVKLLRVLEEKNIRRVGGTRQIPVDVRVVSATNRDLRQAVSEGLFREDLFYRISVLPIQLPDLCERPDDIPLLALYFVNVLSPEKKQLAIDAREKLANHLWPGNIRELKNVIERALIHVQGEIIRASDILF